MTNNIFVLEHLQDWPPKRGTRRKWSPVVSRGIWFKVSENLSYNDITWLISLAEFKKTLNSLTEIVTWMPDTLYEVKATPLHSIITDLTSNLPLACVPFTSEFCLLISFVDILCYSCRLHAPKYLISIPCDASTDILGSKKHLWRAVSCTCGLGTKSQPDKVHVWIVGIGEEDYGRWPWVPAYDWKVSWHGYRISVRSRAVTSYSHRFIHDFPEVMSLLNTLPTTQREWSELSRIFLSPFRPLR